MYRRYYIPDHYSIWRPLCMIQFTCWIHLSIDLIPWWTQLVIRSQNWNPPWVLNDLPPIPLTAYVSYSSHHSHWSNTIQVSNSMTQSYLTVGILDFKGLKSRVQMGYLLTQVRHDPLRLIQNHQLYHWIQPLTSNSLYLLSYSFIQVFSLCLLGSPQFCVRFCDELTCCNFIVCNCIWY